MRHGLIEDSFGLFQRLLKLNLLDDSPKLWWPNAGSFETLLGAILTQNTTFHNVELSLKNLKQLNALSFEGFSALDLEVIKIAIRPSGFFNQKSVRLKKLVDNIQEDFSDFQSFQELVNREWLLAQKGIGQESADAILNYACFKEEMVVDAYTNRLLQALGWEFESYEALKSFMTEGIVTNMDEAKSLLGVCDAFEVFALFHGMIVEYCKIHSHKKKVDIKALS